MKNLFLINLFFLLILFSGCQTIENKSEKLIKKENEKLSKFIGQPETELKIVMGNPSDETQDNKGARILIYKNKKYGITCERKFEVNDTNMVVGFSSKGCF
tara:strand:- start:264 stop:566 length:303 start_codon:yes stop_codon:yes gene_type:complete